MFATCNGVSLSPVCGLILPFGLFDITLLLTFSILLWLLVGVEMAIAELTVRGVGGYPPFGGFRLFLAHHWNRVLILLGFSSPVKGIAGEAPPSTFPVLLDAPA
tara:strand:+ start:235 stop:546 length:312 start_codon:yes stop_codon:yes gene_type:complete